MEKFFNEKCGLLYWNADLMWTFLSKKVHMWTFGAKCGPIWQHCKGPSNRPDIFQKPKKSADFSIFILS